MSRVLVVGAGIAGTGAAVAAARAGATVTIVDGGPGATTLATGAIDAGDRYGAEAPAAPVTTTVRDVFDAIGGFVLPARGARLLTTAGVVRPAQGHEAALLDVAAVGTAPIGVVRCDRPGWDAEAFTRAWAESSGDGHQNGHEPGAADAWAVIDATVARYSDERDLPDADFAMRHDDGARLSWLAERLREALGRSRLRLAGLVLPPCLGLERSRAEALSELVGIRCGEAIGVPGGPAGLRFEQARWRALAVEGIQLVRERVTSVARRGTTGWGANAESGWTSEADAVILATGGLIGGGIEYAPGESALATALPPLPRTPFRLTMDAPVTLGARGLPLDLPGSLFGRAPESLAWPFVREPLMQQVGILADALGRVAPGLFVAGDVRADRPRAWLDALGAGISAGAAATYEALSVARPSRSSAPAPPIRP